MAEHDGENNVNWHSLCYGKMYNLSRTQSKRYADGHNRHMWCQKTTYVAPTTTTSESAMVRYSCLEIKKIFNTYIKYFTTTITTTSSSLDLLLLNSSQLFLLLLFFPHFQINFVLLLRCNKSRVLGSGFVRFHRLVVRWFVKAGCILKWFFCFVT